MQGIAFGTIPALLRKNPWAVSKGESDENERLLNYSEVPFQIKWLLCLVVERQGPVQQLRSRESKLVILLFFSGCLLLSFSSNVVDMLMLEPPALSSLVPLVGALAGLTALADILMDGWGVERWAQGSTMKSSVSLGHLEIGIVRLGGSREKPI